jgi:hypothetical protein
LVNKTGLSIHHIVKPPLFSPAGFIFDERATLMVNRWCARRCSEACANLARELDVKLIALQHWIDLSVGGI